MIRIFLRKPIGLWFFLVSILILNITVTFANTTTSTGIPLDSLWKQKIYQFAKNNVKHAAWGIAHSERNYHLSMILAEHENLKVDQDVIFAAAFFHDIGAIEPFRKNDVEHSQLAVAIAEPILKSYGFPMQKWPKVKTAILGHMYYAKRPKDKEAIVLHDADALDFFGTIGIVRLVSITERHRWSPSLAGAFTTLEKFKTEVTNALITHTAKKMALQRIAEMNQFLGSLNRETFNGQAL